MDLHVSEDAAGVSYSRGNTLSSRLGPNMVMHGSRKSWAVREPLAAIG